MGLYLCVFDGDEEIDGVEVGSYADFNAFRDFIVRQLEHGTPGYRFPTLIIHSDCDGEWTLEECEKLHVELGMVMMELKQQSPAPLNSEWQARVVASIGLKAQNAFESFIDVAGEFLLERLIGLADVAIRRRMPILFQ